MELTLTYNAPAAAVHRTLTDAAFWTSRVEKAADTGVTLDRLETGDGTVDVAVSQIIDKAGLPSLVAKAVKGDLTLTRGEAWSPIADGRATGTFSVVTTGLPITAQGTATLTDEGGTSTLALEGEVDVAIKLVGGAIEGLVADQIIQVLKSDQTAVEEWVAANA